MVGKFLANRLVLRPTRNRLEHEGLARVVYPCENGDIEAFICQQRRNADGSWDVGAWDGCEEQRSDLLVLKLAGTMGRGERSTLFPASLLDGRSSEVWTWNPPGYGASAGRATLAGIAAAALDFFGRVVEQRGGRGTRIWVCGNSLGCATGLYLATKLEVDGLVLRNPPPLVDLIRTRNAWWNLGLGGQIVAAGVPPEMDAMLTAGEVTAPIVFIESEADRLVTPLMQSYIRDAHPGPQRRIVLAGAEHDTPIGEEYRDQLREAMEWMWGGGP